MGVGHVRASLVSNACAIERHLRVRYYSRRMIELNLEEQSPSSSAQTDSARASACYIISNFFHRRLIVPSSSSSTPFTMPVANGNADPSTPPASASHTIPHVIGINFGNAFSSIAILSGKEKGLQPECIANEDGERQIASAVSFHGEQIYIGNEALHQLVKNPKNTITGFRNLLGKKYVFISLPRQSPCLLLFSYFQTR